VNELARVELLRALFAREDAGVRVAIGDDAAVVAPDLVWTVDAQVEGTHFRREWLSWEDVGWRSFMAAASDLAAMGAAPVAALSALVLAPSVDDAALEALAKGQRAAADACGMPVVGGNLARGTETSITTTVLGRAARPILRSGAQTGDAVWLAGPVGLAAAGLVALGKNMQDARIAPALAAWRRPVARLPDGLAIAANANAAIDVSDGLARDAAHVASASDVTIELDSRAILAACGAALASAAEAVGRDALDLALAGGEDYALVVAAAAAPSASFARIGSVVTRGEHALLLDGAALEPSGFDHF
jgi:thiamine-monophosphate kinase